MQIGEIRTVAGDGLWLSGAYGEDVVALHFTWIRAWQHVHDMLPLLEEVLLPLGARPHWGKCFIVTRDELESAVSKVRRLHRLRRRADPAGKFVNAFSHRVLGY